MCKAADIAKLTISYGIEFKESMSDEKFLMDFYKVNKLLYLAQGCYLAKYGEKIFEEDIYAYPCGPYIKELEFIFNDWEYEPITKHYDFVFTIPSLIRDYLKNFILEYGIYDKQILGITTKKQSPWKEAICDSTDYNIISTESIQNYFSGINDLKSEIEVNG